MRATSFGLLLVALFGFGDLARAGDGCASCRQPLGERLSCWSCGLFARRTSGLETDCTFNCGCNGSYKFPVPPLYTYHWPGMYSAELMTDYHSSWRFPALKPYYDEPGIPSGMPAAETASRETPSIVPVSFRAPSPNKPTPPLPARGSREVRQSDLIRRAYGD